MRHTALAFAAILLASPALATDTPCAKELKRLFGERTGAKVPPKVTHASRPQTPTREGGTCSGSAENEVLIDLSGKVRQVWPLRRPVCDPSWPELDRALT